MIGIMRGTGIAQFGRCQPLSHAAERHRMPVAVKVFVRQVVSVLLLHSLDALGYLRIHPAVQRVGGKHALGKIERGVDPADDALAAGTMTSACSVSNSRIGSIAVQPGCVL